MKRWLKTGIMSLFLLFCGLAFPQDSLAAETLALSDAAARAGEVTLTLTLNSEEARSGSVNICFDSTNLTFISAEQCEGVWSGVINRIDERTVRANFASTTALAADTELYTLTFYVRTNTPAEGIEVSLQDARLYDMDGALLECETLSGTVYGREWVQLQVSSAERTPGQTVQVGVDMELDLDSGPAGGSFFMEYDPDLLEPTEITSGNALNSAQLISNLNMPGVIKLSFAGTTACPEGNLCYVTFRVLDSSPAEAALTLTNASMQDEAGVDMPVKTAGGTINIRVPSANAPTLYVTDAVITPDGAATADLMLQGQDLVCGGQLTLEFDPSMAVSLQAYSGCTYKLIQDGQLRLSWASAETYTSEVSLLTMTFSNAVESTLALEDVILFDSNSTVITDVAVQSGALIAGNEAHTFTNYVSNNDATCEEDGTETAWCDCGCGESDTRTVTGSRLGHSYTNYISNNDATCQANGTETAVCDHGCGTSTTRITENSIIPHKFTLYAPNGDTTCEKNGTETALCDYNCGTSDTRIDSDSQLSHSYTDYIANNDATCLTNGTETAVCDHGCGTEDTRFIPNSTLAHKYTTYVSNRDATCEKDGTETAQCDYGCRTTNTRTKVGSQLSHSYSSGVCIHCGAAEELVSFRFVVSQTTGRVGETVDVTIDIVENPGIIAACMSLSYDADKLTLIEATDTGLLHDRVFSQTTTTNPYLMRWEESLATENNTATGTIVTLKFKIAEDCPLGTLPLTLTLSSTEIYNTALEAVKASAVSGSIEVIQYLSGDANSDGIVNSMDVTLLRRYLANWPNVSINQVSMDVNDDGLVNSLDVTILRRYLAGWSNISLLALPEADGQTDVALTQAEPLRFVVSNVVGAPGEEVEVTVSVADNPGIIAACMSLAYDNKKLKLLSVTDNELLNDCTFSETIEANPYAMRWEDSLATENNVQEGVIATLKFRILEACEFGDSALTLSFRPGEVYDVDLNPVSFEINHGNVKVEEKIEVNFDAVTGTVTIPKLPETVSSVFATVSSENQILSCASGTSSVSLDTDDLADATHIKVFYLDDQYCPVAEPGFIKVQ